MRGKGTRFPWALLVWVGLIGGSWSGLTSHLNRLAAEEKRAEPAAAAELVTGVTWQPGAVNRVLFTRNNARLAVYGVPTQTLEPVEWLLIPQGRRDTAFTAGEALARGTRLIAPAREKYWLEQPHDFWRDFVKNRFHDYNQQTTKILASPLTVERWVVDADRIDWQGLSFTVLETPGFTRGAATYVVEVDGQRLAFTGDLIYGDGQILDLYSFQDAIPAAQIRGYHGYASRLSELVTSLRKVAEQKPTLLIPARGPVIRDPVAAIGRLIERVQAQYRNYLSTNALHWYFKEERMKLCGKRVLGDDAPIELMPYAYYEMTPNWVYENSTSRLIISAKGRGFLLDCGNTRVITAIQELIQKGLIQGVDGIFVTHYHDDHTDAVQAAAETFNCPVYATNVYRDLLENPAAYHLPAMTANPIRNVRPMDHGKQLTWNEYQFTFYDYPGQTFYHGALLVKKADAKPIFFVGDSYAPSGIDDYCLQNRNLLHEDSGYLRCFRQLRELGDVWVVNEHIPHVFQFSPGELDGLERRYRERITVLRELFPWDDPNYGVDEQWAVFYPYGAQAKPDEVVEFQLRLTNHSPTTRTFRLVPHASAGLELLDQERELTLEPRANGHVTFRVRVGTLSNPGLITADVLSPGMEFQHWVEAMVTHPAPTATEK